MLYPERKRIYCVEVEYSDRDKEYNYYRTPEGAEDCILRATGVIEWDTISLFKFVPYENATNLLKKELIGTITFKDFDNASLIAMIRALNGRKLAEAYEVEDDEWKVA